MKGNDIMSKHQVIKNVCVKDGNGTRSSITPPVPPAPPTTLPTHPSNPQR